MAFEKKVGRFFGAAIFCLLMVITKQKEICDCECSGGDKRMPLCPLLLKIREEVADRTNYIEQLIDLRSIVESLQEDNRRLSERIQKLESPTEPKDQNLTEICSSILDLCSNGNQGLRNQSETSGLRGKSVLQSAQGEPILPSSQGEPALQVPQGGHELQVSSTIGEPEDDNEIQEPTELPEDTAPKGCGSFVTRLPLDEVNFSYDTVAGEWPWMVALSKLENNNSIFVYCSGVLLDERTVLTSAWCHEFWGITTLQFGMHSFANPNDAEVVRTKFRVIDHPRYEKYKYVNDIALIKLDSDLKFSKRISPICLPTPLSSSINLVPGNYGIGTGWKFSAKALNKHKIEVLPTEACRNRNYPIGPHNFCVKAQPNWWWYGSPLVFYDENTHRYILEGLCSKPLGDHNELLREEIYTKVSNFLNWIDYHK